MEEDYPHIKLDDLKDLQSQLEGMQIKGDDEDSDEDLGDEDFEDEEEEPQLVEGKKEPAANPGKAAGKEESKK